MSVWDNQQATSWFTGVLQSRGLTSVAWTEISSTDDDIIENCVNYLNSESIAHTVYDNDRLKQKKRLKRIRFQFGASTTTRSASLVADKYWLIGFFESQASITLTQNHLEKFVPDVSVRDIKAPLLEKVMLTLKSLNCAGHVACYKKDVPDNEKAYHVSIRGILRVQRFLTATAELYRSKLFNKRVNVVLNFIKSRLEKPQEESYSERERQYFLQLKSMI